LLYYLKLRNCPGKFYLDAIYKKLPVCGAFFQRLVETNKGRYSRLRQEHTFSHSGAGMTGKAG